jgi:putative polymerase
MAITFDTGQPIERPSADAGEATALLKFLAVATVLGGLMFNLFLCFVNTKLMALRDSHAMAFELAIIAVAFFAAADRRAGLYLFIGIFVSYMIMLFAMQGVADPKAVRDVMVPVIFIALGSRVKSLALADMMMVVAAILIILFALIEYFLLENYLNYFNVLGYYISKGAVRLEETFGISRGLFISGNRPEPRTILPFLGQHRVSSVFLEPVSMGNFGVITFAWAMFRQQWAGRYFLFVAALFMVTMADARFGLFTCILIAAASPFFRIIPRTVWLVMPFLFLALIAAYGLISGTNGGPNDLSGRIAVTAHILTDLSPGVVFGFEATERFTADSGLVYTLTKFGLIGFIGLWAAYVFMPFKDPKAWQFHSMMTVYLLLIMVISNSFYSIKTGSLMWFLLGTVSAIDLPKGPPIWMTWLSNLRSDERSAT